MAGISIRVLDVAGSPSTDRVTLDVVIRKDGTFAVEDYGIGPASEAVYSDSDTEAFLEVKREHKDLLLAKLAAQYIADHGNSMHALVQWMEKGSVPHKFSVW